MDEGVVKTVQPHSNEAEKAVIGAILLNPEKMEDVSDMLVKEDFFNPQYGIMFEAMVELYKEGIGIDSVELNNRLVMKGVPEEMCNPDKISELLKAVPLSAKVKNHAQIILDKSMSRKLIKFTDEVNTSCFQNKERIDTILEGAEQNLFKLVQQRNGSSDFVPMQQITINVLEEIEKARRAGGKVTGLSTGFVDLDNMLTGLHGGELLLVAARPAMGKTAFVLNIAHYLAVKKDVPCAFFSLEMSKEQLVSRVLAIDAMVDSKDLKLGRLSDDEWYKVIDSIDRLSRAPMYIDDNSAISIGELRSKCRKLKQNNGIGIIMLDYLQLMTPSRAVESRQQFVAEVSRALKNLARELDVPVIALSQLSRAVDSRQGNKPVLSDLRESGAIEQDADVVMFIYRDEYYNPDTTEKPQTAEIIIAKQRAGETGSVDLRWLGKYTKFANPEKHYSNPDK